MSALKPNWFLVATLLSVLLGCGVYGPKERWAYIGSLSGEKSASVSTGLQQLVVGVPSGAYDYNGYAALWRHADYYEITYHQERAPSAGQIIRALYKHDASRPPLEIRTHPKSKVLVFNCVANVDLYFEDGMPIEKANGVYDLSPYGCKK